jgi:hypothetical protein
VPVKWINRQVQVRETWEAIEIEMAREPSIGDASYVPRISSTRCTLRWPTARPGRCSTN